MWSVVFYAPNNVHKVLFKSKQRGEAEASKQRYERLIGAEFKLEIIFDAPTAVMPAAQKDDGTWTSDLQPIAAPQWQTSPYPGTQP